MLGLHNTGNDHSPHRAADCLSYEGVVRAVINRPFAAGAKPPPITPVGADIMNRPCTLFDTFPTRAADCRPYEAYCRGGY